MNGVAEFFNGRAEDWGRDEPGESPVQGAVAALAGPLQGRSVIDAGCGTGVMVRHYLEQGAERVLGVDLAENMLDIAGERFAGDSRISFIAVDLGALETDERFDALVIYNAYPHMLDKEAVLQAALRLLKPEGRFVIAHGAGRQAINERHRDRDVPDAVSCGLRAAEDESLMWAEHFSIDALVDSPGFYAIAGRRK